MCLDPLTDLCTTQIFYLLRGLLT